ncbi:Pyruvate kinase [Amphibalanus amphitrite]|uniref:Pyruvate kinase n=1 Tax=Amphibalanus amphitrite TaxID=1232801 RepID=A0A6A4XET5_AMPAM|nr:Pyruvate kinase [Amphibalanus amphitrite]
MDTPTETGAVVQGSEQVRIGAGLDPRLIDEYDGSGDVVEWHTQASLLCEYRGVSAAEVLPMRLKGGAFAVWSQLSAVDRRSATATRDALFKAFAMDDFAAHTAFVARRLEPGESADVFLASLRRYAALFGGVTDRQLVAAFVNGLPASVADTIRAGTRSEQLSLESTVARARAVLAGWDDPTEDVGLRGQVDHVVARLNDSDPARGPWRLKGDKLVVWTDASSIAAGVVLEDPEGGVVEDASWLRPESKAAMHINMAELDAALSGVNMAIAWGITIIDLCTDSATVHKWIDDALTGRSRLRTKAHGEMLIRRRIDVILFRPPCPIIAVTRFPQVARQCHLHRGIIPLIHTAERVADWLQDVEIRVQYAVNHGKDRKFVRDGDPLVIVTGWKSGAGFTNTMRVIYA